MVRKLISRIFLMLVVLGNQSWAQAIVDPIGQPYFVIERDSPYVHLPKHLGGNAVNGFAGISMQINELGKPNSIEIIAIKLSGKTNLSYNRGVNKLTPEIKRYEDFLKQSILKTIEIVKTDTRTPPKVNRINFLIRFH